MEGHAEHLGLDHEAFMQWLGLVAVGGGGVNVPGQGGCCARVAYWFKGLAVSHFRVVCWVVDTWNSQLPKPGELGNTLCDRDLEPLYALFWPLLVCRGGA